jgi:hypothetical protein
MGITILNGNLYYNITHIKNTYQEHISRTHTSEHGVIGGIAHFLSISNKSFSNVIVYTLSLIYIFLHTFNFLISYAFNNTLTHSLNKGVDTPLNPLFRGAIWH